MARVGMTVAASVSCGRCLFEATCIMKANDVLGNKMC